MSGAASSADWLEMILESAHVRETRRAGTTTAVRWAGGFYEEQSEAEGRWASSTSAIEFEPDDADRFLAFQVLSEFRDLSQALSITIAGRSTRIVLPSGWSPVSVFVPAGADRAGFSVNKLLPAAYHPRDPRGLGVRLRAVGLHVDRDRHEHVAGRQRNLILNAREVLAGRPVLESTPPNIGIDLYGACNIKPPCVYCGWDASKAMEGDSVDTPFTIETLHEWGPFFDHSTAW